MKLQSKLIISFSVMLLLVACTTASGWYAMSDMARMASQITQVDNTLANIQTAQAHLLRFMQTKEQLNKDTVYANLKQGSAYMKDALLHIQRPSQKDLADRTIAGIALFEKNFTTLSANIDKSLQITAAMQDLNEELAKLSGNTLKILEDGIKNEFTTARFDSYTLMNQADSYLYMTQGAVRSYLLAPSKTNADMAFASVGEARKRCVEAEHLLIRPENKAVMQKMTVALDNYTARLKEFFATEESTLAQYNATRQHVLGLVEACNSMSSAAGNLLRTSRDTGNTINLLSLAIAFLIGIGITVFLSRNVNRQLGKDPGELAIIADRVTQGDYNIDDGSARMGVYDNIVGMVSALKGHIENAQKAMTEAQQQSAKAVTAMEAADVASKDAQAKRDSILVAADKLEEVAHVVSSASEELSAQIEQSERGASEQAARVGETATAMEEMNSTVLEVARNASSANDGGKSMRSKAIEGADIVESSVREVQKARADALALKDDMNVLSEQAQSIGQIMNVISDIADQTNLLALNAAIEAARAGEAGRGFAVVADEVRKLAEKTMQSTTDVGNAIKSIQASAAKNMAQVDATVKNIESSSEQAEKSGKALREIVDMIDTTVDQVSAIATASEQQSATSEEINRSVAQVNTIAGETARAMQEAAQAVSDLSRQAQILTRLIEDMKKG